ncbi:MAG: Gfo/Idh/MocA family protein [Xenococcaceae cyanobacterium]
MNNRASEILRFGVLGYGKIARTRFLPSIARIPSARLTALGTRQLDRIDPASLPVSEPPQILRYEELLEKGRQLVDAVYIALPNDMHEEWVLRCSEAGLHVLCEKPLAASQDAALRCRQKCQERGVLLAEAFMYRHDPRHRRVKELIQTGKLGKVHLLEASFSYFKEDLNNIRLRADRQGGALMDIGSYCIDCARFILEEEPVEVTARCVRGDRSGVDELVTLTLLFPSGSMAVITASTHLAREHRYCVRGTQGTATAPKAFIAPDSEPTQILIEYASGERQVENFPPFPAFETEIAHFARAALANDPALLPPAEDGVANAGVLEAAIRSMGEGHRADLMEGGA